MNPVPLHTMTQQRLHQFATNYAAAWSSQNASSVAAFFAENGSLTINGGPPSIGRAAITADAQSFMTAFPDMIVTLDRIHIENGLAIFAWILTGTYAANANPVRISGHEAWQLNPDGLIGSSHGHFDADDYARQISPA
ncbi:MAG: nuclear transport factor 2 family protein [Acidobacteriota bacterium]|jgi:hypothetical protein